MMDIKTNLINLGLSTILLSSGCRTMDLRIKDRADLARRLKETEITIHEKREESNMMNLEDKAAYFEQDLYNNFRVEPYFLFADSILNIKSPHKTAAQSSNYVSIEKTISFLSALAFKYSVTHDSKTRSDTLALLDSIFELDKANGLDGYLPFSAIVKDGKLLITNNHTHSNVYDQLMFAYANVFSSFDDEEVKGRISRHTKLVVSHFLNNNFAFKDSNDGKLTEDTNAKTRGLTARSNNTTGIMLVEAGLHMIQGDESLKGRLLKERKDFKDNYRAINNTGKIRYKILGWEFPTHSTLWLHTQTVHTLATLTGEKLYKDALARMHRDYAGQENPFLNAAFLNTNKVSDFEKLSLISKMKGYLQSFPLVKDSREILQSPKRDIPLAHPRYIKFKHEYESEKPLPIYMRPGRADFLKSNQQEIDGNIGSDNRARYSGIDYLLQYWFTLHLDKDRN